MDRLVEVAIKKLQENWGWIVLWIVVGVLIKIFLPNVFAYLCLFASAVIMAPFCFIGWLMETLGGVIFTIIAILFILVVIIRLALQDKR